MKSTTPTTARTDTLISEKSGFSDEEDHHLTMSVTPTTKVFWQLKQTNAPSSGVVPKKPKRRRARSTGCFGMPFDLLAFLRSMSVFQLDASQNNTKRIQSPSPQFEPENVGEVKKVTAWPLLNSEKSQAARDARLAAKRSAAIDRQLEQDRDAWCRKAQVMVTGFGRTKCEGKTLFFDQMRKCSGSPESSERNNQITGRHSDDSAGKVRTATMKEMRRILQEIHTQVADYHERSRQQIEEPLNTLLKTVTDLYEHQLSTLQERLEINDHTLGLVQKVTDLWSNPTWTNLCYRTWGRSKPFDDILLSLLTRSFTPTYTPTPTDLSHIRHFSSSHRSIHQECLTPFPSQSSLTLDLIDRDNTGCCSFLTRKIFHFLSTNLSVLMLVDLGSYSQVLYEDNSVNHLQESLSVFQSIVDSRKFAEQARGAMMLLLWNSEGLERQLEEGGKPLGDYMKDFKGKRGEEREWIKKEFEKVVKRGRYGRDVKVRVGEPGEEGTVRWAVEAVKTGLLDQELCELGLGREGRGHGWYQRR